MDTNGLPTVLVTGGRDYTHSARMYEILDAWKARIGLLINGASRGADRMATNWARSRGVPFREYPALWDTHGKSAGYRRNEKMIRDGKPAVVIAFAGGVGTQHQTEIALKAGIKVIQVRLNSFKVIDPNDADEMFKITEVDGDAPQSERRELQKERYPNYVRSIAKVVTDLETPQCEACANVLTQEDLRGYDEAQRNADERDTLEMAIDKARRGKKKVSHLTAALADLPFIDFPTTDDPAAEYHRCCADCREDNEARYSKRRGKPLTDEEKDVADYFYFMDNVEDIEEMDACAACGQPLSPRDSINGEHICRLCTAADNLPAYRPM